MVFNRIAAAYDRNRSDYPGELIDRAAALAGLVQGDPVLEIGAGTGKLTRLLTSRGLRVTAVEPGEQMIALARQHLDPDADVEFLQTRLEEARLKRGGYRAAFAAASIHWVDPDVGWRLIADTLSAGATINLIGHIGLADAGDDQAAVHAIVARVTPELAAQWPEHRDVDSNLAGVHDRRGNISAAWSWLVGRDLARDYVASLFDDAELTLIPIEVEHTADELIGLIATMSWWQRITASQQQEISAGIAAMYAELERPLRASTAACMVSARRSA